MNINTSSTYTYGSSASKGMSGLASGLDTESLVKEMLSGTQSKIDAQQALKQQTEWKQEIYRDLIDQINNFQTGYFSGKSATSLTNSAFYNTMSAASSSSNFKVTASSTAVTGNTSLEVHQLASSYSMASSSPVSGKLSGSFDAAGLQALLDAQRKADRTLVFNVGNKDTAGSTEVRIDLNSCFKTPGGSLIANPDAGAIASAVQNALKQQAGLDAAVTISGGQFSIVSKDAERSLAVSSSSTKEALSALGLTSSSEARANVGKTQRTLSGKVSLAPTLDFAVALDDGLQGTVKLDLTALMDADGKLQSDKVQSTLQSALDAQFGRDTIKVSQTDSTLSLTTPVAGRKLVVYAGADKEVLGALGLRNGQSNRINLYDTLKQMPASTPLQGSEFEFEINGIRFHFTENDDIDMVMRTVNSSEAGVTMTYKPLDDAFVITSNNSGAGYDIRMSQTKGNLLNVLLGGGADGKLATGNTVVSAPWTSGGKLESSRNYLTNAGDDVVRKGSLSLTVNGKDYTVSIPEKGKDAEPYTLKELVDALNSELKATFGTTPGSDNVDVEAIQLALDEETGKIRFVVNNGASVSLAATRGDVTDEAAMQKLAGEGNLAAALGFVSKDRMDNLISGSTTLETAGLGDWAEQWGLSRSLTLDELAAATAKGLTNKDAPEDKLALQLSFEDGKLTVTGLDPEKPLSGFDFGGSAKLTRDLFGSDSISLGAAADGQPRAIVSEGRNAVVRIDGALTERSSNVFSYNGLTVELTGVSAATDGGASMTYIDENGKEQTWKSVNGRWVDAQGYERASDGQYVIQNADGTAKRAPSLDAPLDPGFTFKRYAGTTFYDANGQRMANVGIDANGSLVDADGNAIKSYKAETISVTRDTDKIVEGVRSFIDEYNKLVKTINDLLNEEANYRDYAPLTDEQRAEMSDRQIELWEEKAKQGLLRRDSILDGFLRDMRSIWYETNSSGYAIYQLGIETGEWSTRGQLTFGQDGEATLRQMLASDPAGVMSFFANSVDGAAVRVSEVIKRVANTSSGSPGSLVELAGIKGMATEKNNTLYNKIKQIDEKIERLQNQYKQEKDRYWNQFNVMEQQIQNMNTQSAWLASQFSYSY